MEEMLGQGAEKGSRASIISGHATLPKSLCVCQPRSFLTPVLFGFCGDLIT